MQQTKLDRWLQKTFVNETLILTVRQPPYIPKGLKLHDLPQSLNNNFRYKLIVRNQKDVDTILAALKKDSQTFTTRVQHRPGLAAKYFSNPSGKSFTINILGSFIGAVLVFSLVIFFPNILIEYFHEYVVPLGGKFKTTAIETWQGFFNGDNSGATDSIRETTPK